MIRTQICNYLADVTFRTLKTEQVLAFDIERPDLGGLFVSKETGLYALYHQTKGQNAEGNTISTSTLSLCGLESKQEYADLVEEASTIIRVYNPTEEQGLDEATPTSGQSEILPGSTDESSGD